MIESLGILGSVLLALCGLPMLLKALKDKHVDGVSLGFLWMWFLGEVFVFVYVYFTSMDYILLANYGLNVIVIGKIMLIKYGGSND